MGLWIVRGGNRLYGTIQVQGAKNGVLPVLAASLIHPGLTIIERAPRVRDVTDTLEILRCLSCRVKQEGDCITVDSRDAVLGEIPQRLVEHLRSSVLFLGAMIARFGEGMIPLWGECLLGPRPVDLHLAALSALGAQLELEDQAIRCLPCKLHGGEVDFPFPSVGATEQAMLAACGCDGATVLRNCAKEPEVEELGRFLCAMGAQVVGAGTDTIRIFPGSYGGVVRHLVLPDRIAAGTFLCAAAACGGKLTLREVICPHLRPILDELEKMGCNIKAGENWVTLQSDGRLWSPSGEIVTGPYPQFPTDAQPALMAAALCADGVTILRERVFAGRLHHARQLRRFGGNICLTEDCCAVVTGVNTLQGTYAEVCDLQGGAALLIAALQAQGESRIVENGHISRGYEFLDAVLRQLGAEIEYIE